jgi:hypothetical protein
MENLLLTVFSGVAGKTKNRPAMKNQSLLFSAAQDRARSPFLWAVALRIRHQSQRRPSADQIGPVAESVIEISPRRFTANCEG